MTDKRLATVNTMSQRAAPVIRVTPANRDRGRAFQAFITCIKIVKPRGARAPSLGRPSISSRTCRKFKADMLDLERTFLKPVRSPKVFAAVVDFADLPSDLELSGDSESFPCESESLN